MNGKVVLITGGNAGVGKETAVGLAREGAHVVFTSRDPARGADALADIRKRSGSDTVEVMPLDLASFASIRTFSEAFLASHDRLDVLVNNAGLVQQQRALTDDGFEMTFGVNHLGHFLLTSLLLDRLCASAPARVVVVSSHAHKHAGGGLDFDDLQSERAYKSFQVYGKTKLANIYFTREQARRVDPSEVTVNALHPGFVASRFGRDGDTGRLGDVAMVLGRPFAISPEKGALTSIWLASSPDVEGTTGGYFYKCKPSTPSKLAQDDEIARRLWAVSDELVAGAGA
ncbi:MAG: SDR family oxidoreductase [Acidimicrobiia bacterium]|nr:SDR family oxidoreductase [Acidimicrobiia bacterium]